MAQGQRRLAAIMFTDMVGYTALTQSDEAQAIRVLETHNQLLRPFFSKHHGREIKAIGDSFLVEFDSALGSAQCAVEIQEFLHEYNLSANNRLGIRLRIGIHLGDVIHKEDDVFGDAVNIASRIEPVAKPEGICVSEQVYDQIRNKFRFPLVKLEPKKLKNISVPTDVYEVSLPWQKDEGPEGERPPNRIAILPFANTSPDPADEYFADGMTEEVISTVSRIEGIEVISRTSAMQYKSAPKPIKEISRELDVGTVLEGSVRKAGNRLRVAVQMIDATKDRHVWAESYDRDFGDVFEIQGDIASKIADAMKTKLSGREAEIAKQSTSNLEAYTLYLRAVQLYHESTEQALKEAISLFEVAISKDLGFVRAFAGLAHSWGRMVSSGYEDFAPGIRRAEAAALRAIELGPNLAEAHAAMADISGFMDRFEQSISESEKAIGINSSLSEGHLSLGIAYGALGRLNRAMASFERARQLDPLSFRAGILLAEAYRVAGRVGDAMNVLEKLKELNPRNALVYSHLADCYVQQNDFSKAQEMLDEGSRLNPHEPLVRIHQGFLYALTKRTKEAQEALKSLEADSRESVRLRAQLLIRYASGNLDGAFEALMRAAETHSWYAWMKSDPLFESLRKDTRFTEFCMKAGLPA